jgi:tetratricopeptide (TPR) repeat protein
MARSGLNTNAQHTAGFLSLPLLLLPLFLMLGACASQPTFLKQTAPLRGLTVPTVSEPNFSQISPAMLDFLDKYVEQRRGKEKATFSLVWAATDQNLRRFDYRPELTLSPTETFDQKTGNCLSFSAMFMMMARHLDLNAWYQEVEVPQQWSNNNDTLLVSMHVNVVIESTRSGASWVIDVSGMDNSRYRLQRRIKDSVVLAQYYNNLGAEALTEADLGRAFAYFTKAIETEPGLHYLWSNLGVVYSRNEQLDDAIQAYEAALDLDSSSTMAANNLYMIYEKTGNLQAGADLQKRVEKNRRKNPYYLTHLSTVAYDEGRLEESRELVEKALKLQQNEYRFHYQLARILGREGRRSEAEASLQRALDLAPADAAENLAHLTALEALPELP